MAITSTSTVGQFGFSCQQLHLMRFIDPCVHSKVLCWTPAYQVSLSSLSSSVELVCANVNLQLQCSSILIHSCTIICSCITLAGLLFAAVLPLFFAGILITGCSACIDIPWFPHHTHVNAVVHICFSNIIIWLLYMHCVYTYCTGSMAT